MFAMKSRKVFAERTNNNVEPRVAGKPGKQFRTAENDELANSSQKSVIQTDNRKLGWRNYHPTISSGLDRASQYLSPFEVKKIAFEKERKKQGWCDYMVVTGMDTGEEYSKADKETKTKIQKALTQSQVDKIRIIMMPKTRLQDVRVIREIVLGYQMHEDIKNAVVASFAYELLDAFELVFKRLCHFAASPAKRFNYLLAFTNCFLDHSVWETSERGWDEEDLIGDLALMWKNLLAEYSAEELSLDEEFSKPGIQAFLQKTKKKVESIPMYGRPMLQFDLE